MKVKNHLSTRARSAANRAYSLSLLSLSLPPPPWPPSRHPATAGSLSSKNRYSLPTTKYNLNLYLANYVS